MNKTFFIIFSITILGFSLIVTNNDAYARYEPYSSECDMILMVPPEEFLQKVGEKWNYNPEIMPPLLKSNYICIEKIYNNGGKSTLNLSDIQSKADQKLQELGQALLRQNSD